MDICHLKNAELEAKHQKFKGRIVLRGDTVKDDSGSYAVFTEQGSLASQMTAAKVMDIISVLPGCGRQTADAVSAYTQVKWKNASSEVRMSRYLDTSTKTQMAKIMVQHGRPSCSPWAESVQSSSGRTIMGTAIRESSIETRLGKSFMMGMLMRWPRKKTILVCVRGRYQIGRKETTSGPDVESTYERSRLGRANIIPWPCILGMHSKTLWNKQRYCWQLQNHVRIANFRGRNWKASILREFSYFFVVLWHGWSCKEMCGTILWVGKQDDATTLQSIYSLHRWPPLQRRRIEIRRRIVKSIISNCSEMLKLGTCWTTRYSMVSESTCTIDFEMDQSLWQTIISFDLLHSSYMWLQTVLLCG